jgi:hypothetical protein
MKRKKINNMANKAFWLGTLLMLSTLPAITQCNHHLVDIAAGLAGADAIYIREFKVKLSKGTMDEPSPTGKFPLYLNKGVQYRFTIANAREYDGKAIVELDRRDQRYAGNFDFNNSVYSSSFDFTCDKSATYQLLINYGSGKEGCSAVVMNMVIQDSLAFIDPSAPYRSDSAEVLYLWVENELQIASSEGKGAVLDVRVSNGSIERKPSHYVLIPAKTGPLKLNVDVIKNNKIVESDSVTYFVEYPPLPQLQFATEIGNQLSVRDFDRSMKIEMVPMIENGNKLYKLESFSIVPKNNFLKEYKSNGAQLSVEQISFIRKLKAGDAFFIRDIRFSDPEGKSHSTFKREIIIAE